MATLILTCSTGQGHNSCARAIQEYYDRENVPCMTQDALGFISPGISRVICGGHVTMYRHFHGLFQIGYRYSERHSNMFREKSGIYKLLTLGTDRIRDYIEKNQIDTVICTHVFASLMMTQLQKQYDLPIRTCLVATDYTCNPGTKESVVDLHFIPDEPLSVFYECPNILDSQIVSSGIPVRQMFYTFLPKEQAKDLFSIPRSHRHLLMMCGSMGCGPMKKLAKRLTDQMNASTDLTVVCGTNRKLHDSLTRKYRKNKNVHILGYVENMSALMDSADLCLTKPGGISVTECATKKLPMVFIDAVAGCEEYNKIYFIKLHTAKTGMTVRDIAEICTDILAKPRKLEKMRNNLASVCTRNASQVIFETMQEYQQPIVFQESAV